MISAASFANRHQFRASHSLTHLTHPAWHVPVLISLLYFFFSFLFFSPAVFLVLSDRKCTSAAIDGLICHPKSAQIHCTRSCWGSIWGAILRPYLFFGEPLRVSIFIYLFIIFFFITMKWSCEWKHAVGSFSKDFMPPVSRQTIRNIRPKERLCLTEPRVLLFLLLYFFLILF